MCGIAGLFAKREALQPQLGAHLSAMLEQLAARGPDSTGVAFYREPAPDGWCKVSLFSAASEPPWRRARGRADGLASGRHRSRG